MIRPILGLSVFAVGFGLAMLAGANGAAGIAPQILLVLGAFGTGLWLFLRLRRRRS